jgi:hypothetical protein
MIRASPLESEMLRASSCRDLRDGLRFRFVGLVFHGCGEEYLTEAAPKLLIRASGLPLIRQDPTLTMLSRSAVVRPKRSRSKVTRSIFRRAAMARMAFTCEAVAGRGLG